MKSWLSNIKSSLSNLKIFIPNLKKFLPNPKFFLPNRKMFIPNLNFFLSKLGICLPNLFFSLTFWLLRVRSQILACRYKYFSSNQIKFLISSKSYFFSQISKCLFQISHFFFLNLEIHLPNTKFSSQILKFLFLNLIFFENIKSWLSNFKNLAFKNQFFSP